jgi:RNA polymerase sigma factor (sigma-70 family)
MTKDIEKSGLGEPSEATLFRQAQAGCRDSLNALMKRHAGLVAHVVNRQQRWDLPYEDALQAGRLGLWRAILGYDPQREAAFSTYAYVSIMHHVWAAVKRYRQQQDREPAVEELAVFYDRVTPDPGGRSATGMARRAALSATYGILQGREVADKCNPYNVEVM